MIDCFLASKKARFVDHVPYNVGVDGELCFTTAETVHNVDMKEKLMITSDDIFVGGTPNVMADIPIKDGCPKALIDEEFMVFASISIGDRNIRFKTKASGSTGHKSTRGVKMSDRIWLYDLPKELLKTYADYRTHRATTGNPRKIFVTIEILE